MGRDFLDDALAVDIEREGVRVTGFAGLPTLHRPDPGQQYLFVNGRPVKDRLLIGAVRSAYGDLLPKGRHPLLALFVDLPPREVDVNVHPSKAEVRFRDAGRVRALVAGALRAALDAAGHRATATGGSHALDALVRAQTATAAPPAAGRGSTYAPERSAFRPAGFAEDWQAPLEGLAEAGACAERRRARLRRAAARGPARPAARRRPRAAARDLHPRPDARRPSSSSTSTPPTSAWSTSA